MRAVNRQLSICILLLAVGSPARADQLDAAIIARLDALVDGERPKLGTPALSVAIARGDTIVYARATGLADVEQQVPASPRTRFRTASVAKPMTATAIMKLVEAGTLALDAPVQEYCRAFPQKPWPVTVRQLLSHLGGVRHYNPNSGESRSSEHFFTLADAVRVFADDPLVAEPGTKYSYTTFGYTLLGCAIESVTGASFAEHLQHVIFGPAGMADTTVDEHFTIVPNRARGYLKLDDETFKQLPPAAQRWARAGGVYNAFASDNSVRLPGGGLLSTPSDLARFAIAIQSDRLVSAPSRQQMWTRQQTRDGKEIEYGLGWFVERGPRGLFQAWHTGNQPGASTLLAIVPEKRTALAIMANVEDARLTPLMRGVGDILFGPVPPTPAAATDASRAAPRIIWAPHRLALTDGRTIDAERGTLTVAENRAAPGGRTIDIALLRLKSRTQRPGPPIVYLEGGPGNSALSAARVPELFAAFDRLRDAADLILLDQRGTGQSGRLACAPAAPVAGTVFLTADSMRAALMPGFERCLAEWRTKGVDLAHYNTNTIADDVNDLRAALGVERISLVGFSYGTHLGLAYIRRHEPTVHRAVLIAVEGPDHTVKLPSWMNVHLANVAHVAGRPDLVDKLKTLLARFEESPVTFELTHPRTGEMARVQVGRAGLAYIIRRDIGDTNDLPRLPALLDALYAGRHDALKPLVERRYGALASGVALMPFAVDCASGASHTRRAQVAIELEAAILGGDQLDEACDVIGVPDLGDMFRARVTSRVPALFVSGTLDAHTPPFQAEEIRWGFPSSTHLIVERAGHESLLTNVEVQAAAADFLAGEDVGGRRIRHPLKFAP